MMTTLHISQFPRDVLQRIFRIGVEDVWQLSESEGEDLEDDPEKEEDDDSDDVDEDDSDYPLPFQPDYNPLHERPELMTLMDCAQVCTAWADAIINKDYWDSFFRVSYGEALAEPWKLGKRWNLLLKDVPVPILCVEEELLSNIGKIHTSLRRGRDAFEVFFLSNSERKQHIFKSWLNLQPILQQLCLHLTITNQRIPAGADHFKSTQVGFRTLMLGRWPLLQSLNIDYSANDIITPETMDQFNNFLNKKDDVLRANPPFPALKRLFLSTHIDSSAARDITLVAPHIEHCHLRISGYEDDSLQSWKRLRYCGAHYQFLWEDKRYRTYTTPHVMLAFKWPGPKGMRHYEKGWRFFSFMFRSYVPDPLSSEVMISESRIGMRCESILTLDQFFEVEDLRVISIPVIKNL